MAINAAWHRAHRMPSNPTPRQRLRWHEAHARHCACRPFTAAMRARLERDIAATGAGRVRTRRAASTRRSPAR